jgi:hypothetical protein
MKTISIQILGIFTYFAGGASNAATVIFDDFSSGAYDIGTGKPSRQNTSPITAPLLDTRSVAGFGAGAWSSTVDVGSDTFSYVLALRPGGNPLEDHSLRIHYSNSSGNISLLGFDAFVINTGSVVGSAMVFAYVGTGDPSLGVVPVSLNGTGNTVIPFSNMAEMDPTNPSSISFLIVPQTLDFSVTFSGISVIPEPSAIVLSMLGASVLLVRRRPEQRQQNKSLLDNRWGCLVFGASSSLEVFPAIDAPPRPICARAQTFVGELKT